MFEKMCPEEEFLPKAPNPEDIIYDDGETAGEQETGFELQTDTAATANCDIGTTEDSSHDGTDDAADRQEDVAVSDSSPTVTVVNEDSQTQD